MKHVPPFLYGASTDVDDKEIARLAPHMKGWNTVYRHLTVLKKRAYVAQLKEMELMLLYELCSRQRTQILIRIMGRYKMTLNASLTEQMFGA